VQNNNYEKDGETVYSMAFTAEEVDYLDTKAEGEALRDKQGPTPMARANGDSAATSAVPKRGRKTSSEPLPELAQA